MHVLNFVIATICKHKKALTATICKIKIETSWGNGRLMNFDKERKVATPKQNGDNPLHYLKKRPKELKQLKLHYDQMVHLSKITQNKKHVCRVPLARKAVKTLLAISLDHKLNSVSKQCAECFSVTNNDVKL